MANAVAQPILDKAARNPLFVLRVFGLYPGAASSPLYILYGHFVILVFSLIYTALMVCEMFRLRDWSSTEAFYMTVTEVALVVKILNFRLRVRSMAEMLANARAFELENDDEIALLRHYSTRIVQMTIFYFVAVAYAQSSVEIAAMLDENNVLPYPAWYPFFDYKNNNRHYWILYAFQVLGMFVTAYVNVALEMFGAMIMSMNTYQMEVLGMRMRKLGYRGDPKDLKGFLAREFMAEMRVKLVRYLKHHQAIADYKQRIEEYFSAGYIAQASVSAIVLCSIANEMAGDKSMSEKLVIMAMLPGMFLQIFVPCYVGNEIWVEHEKLPTSFYSSNWLEFDVGLRKLIITTMESMKREFFIRMGMIFPLTLITFTKIINLAYRLFALLQNM